MASNYTPNFTDPGALAPFNFVYKYVQEDGLPLALDIYLPSTVENTPSCHVNSSDNPWTVPAVIYFHGGGLTVGDRRSWFPSWLHKRVLAAGCALISVDYRLMPPSTGHDVLIDIKDVFHFVAKDLSTLVQHQDVASSDGNLMYFQIDSARLAVAGTSAGGLCAYLAAVHAVPKPLAVLSMYGNGGDIMTPQYLSPKTTVFFRGRELLDPTNYTDFLYPTSRSLKPASSSPLEYHLATSPTPGYPANPRMFLARLYLQLGVYLDYYTGLHDPSLSKTLREATADEADSEEGRRTHLKSIIPQEHLALFPQFQVTPAWPPTLIVHGSTDTAVLADESRNLHALLQHAGVDATLQIIADEEHSFDYQPHAEEKYGESGGLFDQAAGFLVQRLTERI